MVGLCRVSCFRSYVDITEVHCFRVDYLFLKLLTYLMGFMGKVSAVHYQPLFEEIVLLLFMTIEFPLSTFK